MLKSYNTLPVAFKQKEVKRNRSRLGACLIGLSLIGAEIVTLQNMLPSKDVWASPVPIEFSMPSEIVIDRNLVTDSSATVTARITTVTAYTSHANQTDDTPCISADGSNICERYAKGENICASNDYKLGTVLYVEGLGACTVADRMNRRYTGTNRIDWYYGYDIISAKNHGIKKMYVKTSSK